MTTFGAIPYYDEIVYGDEYETSWNSIESNNNPQKFYKRNYSLSGYGITIGMMFTLWKKRQA